MYLDPNPRKLNTSDGPRPYQSNRGNRDSMSGFFSSQRPVVSPRDIHRTTIRRKPLEETDPNEQNRWPSNTVRLVTQTPSPSGTVRNTGENSENLGPSDTEKENSKEQPSAFLREASAAKSPEKPGFTAGSVSESIHPANPSFRSESGSLSFTTPTHVQYATRAGYPAYPRSEWQNWRSWNRLSSTGGLSTQTRSTSSTLFIEGDSVFSTSARESERESGASDLSTLRGATPEYQLGTKDEDLAAQVRQTSVSALDSVLEATPDRSTVRVVPLSRGSESSGIALRSEPSQTSVVIRPQSSSQSPSEPDTSPLPWRASHRSSSTNSLPTTLTIRRASASSPTPWTQRSQESVIASEGSSPQASSPNFIAYGSDSSPRPRSGSLPLAHSFSVESIQARLQYPTLVRPQTGQSLDVHESWSSPSSSNDTLAPLQVPKKRLRHKTGHISLNKAARAASASEMDEDIDTLPYPREQFTSHLSTIASESDRHSVDTSTRLSHFSLGSGVLTGDDASSILPFSSPSARRRRQSAPIESMVSDISPEPREISSEEDQEPGDMTLGVFREESAKPQPLFQPEARPQSTPRSSKKYDGPLPPLPPIPRDSSEDVDKVSGLPTPSHSLRQKRSGYSLRRRSNSTPSRRISESDRWSHASSIFPLWAKNFYGHGAALMSASKISLSNPESRGRAQGPGHERNPSQWTERSITSRLGTGYSEIDPPSPASSHFLPSIFRPRTRGREGGSKRLQKSKNKRTRPSADDSRPDSMAIFSNPLPESENGNATGETLPSGQPKWGVLKDTSQPPRPLPRKYSKQRRWDEMEFPRPMTKDRLSDFHIQDPHLAPTTRSSYRMSMWRAPSFVESLDTLWRSRCNRQILLFALGFLFPPFWLLGAVLPIPKRPMTSAEYDAEKARFGEGQSEEDIQTAMMKHEAGDAEKRWREEKAWQKGRWWRWLNRIMSVIGVLVLAAVIALVVIATT